jgi:ribonuclease D
MSNNRRRRLQPSNDAGYTWVDDQATFDSLVDDLIAADRIAIDTEFHREKTYWPRVALVQIAVGDTISLVDTVEVDIATLAPVLEGPGTIVMHAASQDLEVLDRACGTIPRDLFDTQIAAGFVGMSTPSLSSLVERYIGKRLPKGDRLTDWFERPLREAQRNYAASDVAHLFAIHDMLTEQLEERGRLQWALDECERSRTPTRPTLPTELAWTKIKEARHLRGKARGVAATLGDWRERTARTHDIPPRFVLSDLALVGVAQRAPTTVEDLRKVRGVDGRFLKDGGGKAILAAVVNGVGMKAEDVPTLEPDQGPTLSSELRPAITLVSAWIAQLAKDEQLDSALLATRGDITDILRGASDARLASGWRADLVGQPIRDLVDGRAALAFDPAGRLLLEPREPPAAVTEHPT